MGRRDRLELTVDAACDKCHGAGRREVRKRSYEQRIGESVMTWIWCECVRPTPFKEGDEKCDSEIRG